MSSAPASTAERLPLAAIARPQPQSSMPACDTRIGPKRATQPPAVTVPIIEPR
jgi:hypothetical protein